MKTIETYPSPAAPDRQITLNLDPDHPAIMHIPTNVELLEFCLAFERKFISCFWEKAVLQESTYQSAIPYGLFCSAAGHSMFSQEVVLGALNRQAKVPWTRKNMRTAGMENFQAALQHLRPATIADALRDMTENGRIRLKAFSLVELLNQSSGFSAFANELTTVALSTNSTKRFAMTALLALRAKDWVLLPIKAVEQVAYVGKGIKMSGNDWAPEPLSYLSPELIALEATLSEVDARNENDLSSAKVKARYAVMCSSIATTRDMTWPFAEKILFSTNSRMKIGANGNASPVLRAHWVTLCQLNGIAGMITMDRVNFRECLQKRCPEDPRLDEWLTLLTKQCEDYTSGNYEPVYQAYGQWLTWLASLENVPRPCEVLRKHVSDPENPTAKTFLNHLAGLELKKAKNTNKLLKKMSDVFDTLVTKAESAGASFTNPIRHRQDRFVAPRRQVAQGTHRKRLDGWVMDELKQMLITTDTKGQYQWTANLMDISVVRLQTAAEQSPVFCPILPAIIYLMLEYPLRSHQVRWLDSGELDSVIYDFQAKSFVPNPRATAETDLGVLQPATENHADGAELPIDFQVAVNKVLLMDRRRSCFVIPYITSQTLWVIQQVLEWQAKYGAAPKHVKEVFEPSKERNRNKQQEDFYPDICPLFRYPTQRAYFPPSIQQLTYFWGQFCCQYDKRNAAYPDPKTGGVIQRTGVPILSKPYKHYFTATHDLHSLRVSGVSFLLDSGLPLAVVASIAGHKTIAMTLHYYRAEHKMLRLKLQQVYAKLGGKQVLNEMESKLKECLNYEDWLRGTPDGFTALKESRDSNSWRISLRGICPGTSCDDGLAKEFERPCGSDVPGSRCALCRFFIYGPPFLPGLIHEYNCILFQLEQKANRQHELRASASEAEDQGDFASAQVFRGEDEHLELECQMDLKVLVRTHNMISECLSLINADGDKPGPLVLMAREPGILQAQVEAVGQFERLIELVRSSEVLPASRHTVPEEALRMAQGKLLGFLRINGASSCLAGLPPKLAKRLTLEFASVLENVVPDDDQRERLIAGELLLQDVPNADGAVRDHVAKVEQQLAIGTGAGKQTLLTE